MIWVSPFPQFTAAPSSRSPVLSQFAPTSIVELDYCISCYSPLRRSSVLLTYCLISTSSWNFLSITSKPLLKSCFNSCSIFIIVFLSTIFCYSWGTEPLPSGKALFPPRGMMRLSRRREYTFTSDASAHVRIISSGVQESKEHHRRSL